MLNLYYRPGCPYCNRVLSTNEEIKANLNLIDISADSSQRDELIAKGGKGQVPYLEDTERGVSMYESADIIDYLAKNYGMSVIPNVLQASNVCPID